MENITEINSHENIVEIYVSGDLKKESYEDFVPILEKEIKEFKKIRILFQMHEFHDYTAGAFWDDFIFDMKHSNDIERLAVVGESEMEKELALFCMPFTNAEVRYFNAADIDEARWWINQN